MATLWTFRCYVSTRGVNEIRASFDLQSKRVQNKFRSRLTSLAKMTRAQWTRPLVGVLYGECEGLWEIRFEKDGVQHRPLGFFASQSEFVIVFWATERGSKFDPLNACKTALARKAEILANYRERTCEYWLPLE
jgi:hypothetical protein